MTEEEYISYFESLAGAHTLIGHCDQACHFWVVHNDNASEVDQAVRNKLTLPALLLDQYLDDIDDTQDNFQVTISGGVSVLLKIEAGNTGSIRKARHQARMLCLQLLKRFRYDCRDRRGAFAGKNYLVAQPIVGEPTAVIGGIAVGWGYQFKVTSPISVALEREVWSDLE